MNIGKGYIATFSPQLFKEDWNFQEHEYCFTVHNYYEDIQIIIPKNLDEFNVIDVWCSGTLLGEFGTVSTLNTFVKEILGETR